MKRLREAIEPFLRGMASILDFTGSLREMPDTDPDADARALASDWRAVGDDLRRAMKGNDR